MASESVDKSSEQHSTERVDNDNDSHEVYILCDYLALFPKTNPLYKVTVTYGYISWEPTSRTRGSVKARRNSFKGKRSSSKQSLNDDENYIKTRQSILRKGGLFISLDDIVGCDCMKGKEPSDCGTYLTIYAYPHKKKIGSWRTTRKRETLTLIFNNCDTYENNMKEAEKWRKVITCLLKKISIKDMQDLSNITIPSQKKMFVLVNPFGGQGKALQMFQQRIVPILAEASITHELTVTEYAGHAKDIMLTLDVKAWYGILIVSGDGLIHEVINGLMGRPDWAEAIKMPIGVLPGGSGNALCCALGYQTGEPYLDNQVLHASFTIAKHSLVPMDLIAIDTFQGCRLYSFLSCCWGIMADVDIESERYRNLGNARFTVGALVRIMKLRRYRGRISFLPVEDYKPLKETHIQRSQSVVENMESSSHDNTLPLSQSTVDPVGTTLNPRSSSLSGNGVEQGLEKVQVKVNGCSEVEVSGKETGGSNINNLKKDEVNNDTGKGVPTPLLTPLDQPVPADWVTLEGEFVNVAAIYLTHLAKDMIAIPESRLNDGTIYLTVTKAGISRMKLIQIFTAMQDGKYAGSPESEIIKVRAFRFEPEEKEGIMTCDGERIEYGPVQGQVLPSMANIMALKKFPQT